MLTMFIGYLNKKITQFLQYLFFLFYFFDIGIHKSRIVTELRV